MATDSGGDAVRALQLREFVGFWAAMKRPIWLIAALVVCLAAPEVVATQTTGDPGARQTPGLELAQTISMITGVAISPLLGVGAVGAWKFFKTAPAQRAGLPWFARPYFWAPALALIALVFLKDALGPALPMALKKPFDLAEVFENKLSALIAAGAFIPLMISVFPTASGPEATGPGLAGFATIDLALVGNALLVPFAMVTFLLVWLAAHAINILILISPFAAVDAALKAFRLTLLASVTLMSFANPYYGAAWSVVLILVCCFLAGWSFRMTVYGTVFAWDMVTLGRKRFAPKPTANRAFTGRELQKVPVRTYGHCGRLADGQFTFRYRPWLVFPSRTLTLPIGDYAIGRGMLHPELLDLSGDQETTVLDFPPRCRTHEEDLNRLYGLHGVRDTGLRAVWGWLKELFGTKPRMMPHSA
jgi:hypothetical protein